MIELSPTSPLAPPERQEKASARRSARVPPPPPGHLPDQRGRAKEEKAAGGARRGPLPPGQPPRSLAPRSGVAELDGDPLIADWRTLSALYGKRAAALPMSTLAIPILTVGSKMRRCQELSNEMALKGEFSAAIQHFNEEAYRIGAPQADITAARYVLCSALDEFALTSEWGAKGSWAAQSLLSEFFNETWGGEKVFSVLDWALAEPAKHLDLLALIDLALAVGFEGRYRLRASGSSEVTVIRRKIAGATKAFAGGSPDSLSSSWSGLSGGRPPSRLLPYWVIIGLTLVLLVVVYYGFELPHEGMIDDLIERLNRVAPDAPEEAR